MGEGVVVTNIMQAVCKLVARERMMKRTSVGRRLGEAYGRYLHHARWPRRRKSARFAVRRRVVGGWGRRRREEEECVEGEVAKSCWRKELHESWKGGRRRWLVEKEGFGLARCVDLEARDWVWRSTPFWRDKTPLFVLFVWCSRPGGVHSEWEHGGPGRRGGLAAINDLTSPMCNIHAVWTGYRAAFKLILRAMTRGLPRRR